MKFVKIVGIIFLCLAVVPFLTPSSTFEKICGGIVIICFVVLYVLGQVISYMDYKDEEAAKQFAAYKAYAKQQKAEAEKKAKAEAEAKAKAEAERKAKAEAEAKVKAEAERKAKAEAERKAKAEAEEKARIEAEEKRKKIEESKSVFEQLEKELAAKNAEIASITNNGAQDIITRAKVKNEISAVNNKIAQLKDEIETLTRDISVSSD